MTSTARLIDMLSEEGLSCRNPVPEELIVSLGHTFEYAFSPKDGAEAVANDLASLVSSAETRHAFLQTETERFEVCQEEPDISAEEAEIRTKLYRMFPNVQLTARLMAAMTLYCAECGLRQIHAVMSAWEKLRVFCADLPEEKAS